MASPHGPAVSFYCVALDDALVGGGVSSWRWQLPGLAQQVDPCVQHGALPGVFVLRHLEGFSSRFVAINDVSGLAMVEVAGLLRGIGLCLAVFWLELIRGLSQILRLAGGLNNLL